MYSPTEARAQAQAAAAGLLLKHPGRFRSGIRQPTLLHEPALAAPGRPSPGEPSYTPLTPQQPTLLHEPARPLRLVPELRASPVLGLAREAVQELGHAPGALGAGCARSERGGREGCLAQERSAGWGRTLPRCTVCTNHIWCLQLRKVKGGGELCWAWSGAGNREVHPSMTCREGAGEQVRGSVGQHRPISD